jgi:hypothetical protein
MCEEEEDDEDDLMGFDSNGQLRGWHFTNMYKNGEF